MPRTIRKLSKLTTRYSVRDNEASVEEGTADGGHVVTITVHRSGSVKAPAKVKLAFSGTADYGSDYILQGAFGSTVSFKTGQRDKKIKLITKSDSIAEGDETVLYGISSIKAYKTLTKIKYDDDAKAFIKTKTVLKSKKGPHSKDKVTIVDDDSPAVYAIEASPAQVFEGSSGLGKTVTYTVTRSGDADKAGSVKVALSGTAANGSDYIVNGLSGGGVAFGAGARVATFTLTTRPDRVFEADETAVATLGAISGGGVLGTSRSASALILNDDGTQRVSVGPGGVEANNGSAMPYLSANGRIVAFTSFASNLVAGDDNGTGDVFVYNLDTGVTRRVSLGLGGADANQTSSPVAISADGRFVAFGSAASNLVAGDTNTFADMFVFDTVSQVTTRVSVGAGGAQGNGVTATGEGSISADGRFVAFASTSSNLAPGDTNGAQDVFLHDRQTHATTRISTTDQARASEAPSLSADGRYLAYSTAASDLVTGDTNNRTDVFVYDRIAQTTTRVSLGANGAQGNGESGSPEISDDGRYVAFTSTASNLVAGDTNGVADVFVFDRQMLSTSRVSVGPNGAQANGKSFPSADISADGRYVGFLSDAKNLVPGDTNGVTDLFVFDRVTKLAQRVSTDSSGAQANAAASQPSISADGQYAAFTSFANNLVIGDANGNFDVFTHAIL